MLDKCRGTYGQPQQPHGQPHGVVPGQFEQRLSANRSTQADAVSLGHL